MNFIIYNFFNLETSNQILSLPIQNHNFMNKNIIAIAVASLGFIIGLGLLGNAIKTETNQKTPSLLQVLEPKIHFRPYHLGGNFSRNSFELKQAYDELSTTEKSSKTI